MAATLLYPPQDYFDYLFLGEDYFTDANILKTKNIREGSRVFFAGMFAHFYGKKRNHPVVRFGNISLLTNEKIEINKSGEPSKLAHFYLVECQSLGGFSGSPVFFEFDRIAKDRIFHTPEIYLGGVMKGHYNDVIETHGIVRELNAALALVTPCYLLKEILYSETAEEERRKTE